MRRRRSKRVPELTPLIDVLFILLFASLIQARSLVERVTDLDEVGDLPTDAGPADAGADAGIDAGIDAGMDLDAALDPIDAGPPSEPEHLVRTRRLAESLARSVRGVEVFSVEVTEDGYVQAISRWGDGDKKQTDHTRERIMLPPLPDDVDERLRYLGALDPSKQICALVRERFSLADDDALGMMVLIYLDVDIRDLPLKFSRGLRADANACHANLRDIGILITPGDEPDGDP